MRLHSRSFLGAELFAKRLVNKFFLSYQRQLYDIELSKFWGVPSSLKRFEQQHQVVFIQNYSRAAALKFGGAIYKTQNLDNLLAE